jgi:YidC/Oxa1 family membrane protein insertase
MLKNYIAFAVFTIAVVGGWLVLRVWVFPKPEPKLAEVKKVEEPPAKNEADGKAKDEVKVPKIDDKKPNAKVDDKKPEPKAPPKIEPKAPEKYETFTLGDDASSFLKVTVTTRGAGVESLSLPKFEAADYMGRPVLGKKLELIRDDPIQPSFRMYHYADPAAKNPLFGLGEANWSVDKALAVDDSGWSITFATTVPGRDDLKIRKTYHLSKSDYHLGMTLEIHDTRAAGGDKTKRAFRYQLTGAHGMPIEGEWYTNPAYMHNSMVGVVDKAGNVFRTMEDANRIAAKEGGERVAAASGFVQYAANTNQYFASAIVVDPDQNGGDWKRSRVFEGVRPTLEATEGKAIFDDFVADAAPDGTRMASFVIEGKPTTVRLLPRAVEHVAALKLKTREPCVLSTYTDPDTRQPIGTWMRKGHTPHPYFDDITVRCQSEELKLEPGESITHKFLIYNGPVKIRLLGQFQGDDAVDPKLVDKYMYAVNLRTLTDYHSESWIGEIFSKVGWTDLLIFCTNLMHTMLYWLHFLVGGNWGLTILLLTVIVRGCMYPISRRQALMSKKMQELGPELKKLQEKHKDDNTAKAQATFELYRKHKINPVGAGCLPLLLQMPIFLGLYYALQESVQFRLANFFWIQNLAAPDMLFYWGESKLPILDWLTGPDNLGSMLYLGPYLNLLPILAAGLMLAQQKLLAPPPTNEEQEMQQKTMQIMMGVMALFFYKVAAGLCLYFIASSLWGVCERKLLPKKNLATAGAAAAPIAVTANPTKGTLSARDRKKAERREKAEKAEEPTLSNRLKKWWKDLLDSASKK